MITFLTSAALLTMGYFIGKVHGRLLERADRITEEVIHYSEAEAIASFHVTPSVN